MEMIRDRIGFMQGRLSPQVDGKIQAFPAVHWRDEFPVARRLNIPLMEWTLDHEGLAANPFVTRDGQREILELCREHGLSIPSVTGDCFMQAPFWKAGAAARPALLDELAAVLEASGALGVRFVVIPLVDNGRVENGDQARDLREGLAGLEGLMDRTGTVVVFESDYGPRDLAAFMEGFPAPFYGVNYDIGNSAALGFNPREEVAAYAGRILNVHVKDRLLGGTTVPLTTGAADLPGTFRALTGAGYAGNWIMQTARAADGDHAGALGRYADMVQGWLEANHGS
jgi:hexulose-6-phosphate isomerase